MMNFNKYAVERIKELEREVAEKDRNIEEILKALSKKDKAFARNNVTHFWKYRRYS